MKPKTSKAKGRRLQNLVRDLLKEAFPSLREDDIKSQTMGMGGEDIVFSPAAKDTIPYSFECKNQERLNIWSSLTQAKDNSNGFSPILIFKRNRSNVYACIDFELLLNSIKENQ